MKVIRVTTVVALGALGTLSACGEKFSAGDWEAAGTGGTGGTAGTGGSSGGTPGECSGSVANGGGPGGERQELIQCSVVDATNGQPACVTNPPILSVQDENSSCGFTTEFVIALAESQPVLAACDALIECCRSLPDSSSRRACFDQVDQQDLQASCTSTLERYRDNGQCQAGSADAGAGTSSADAGDTLSSRHALCCYRVCGYTACN